jgi:mannosyltransferase
MASGCAVVASRTGAFEHIVEEDRTGHVIPTDDVASLVQALMPLMDNPERAIAMGEAGRVRVAEKFSIEQEAAGIAAVYEQVLQLSATPA